MAKKEVRVKVTQISESKEQDSIVVKPEVQKIEKETILVEKDASVLEQKARKFIEDVFETIGVSNVEINTRIEDGNVFVQVIGDEASVLIGRRGEALDSLQMLLNLAVNKGEAEYVRVMLDIENYRTKREESLRKYANKMARQATKQRRIVKLEPMNPYERRIVHSSLKDDRYVKTYSEGKDPYRRVIIEPKYRY